jgi:hypothetical protein
MDELFYRSTEFNREWLNEEKREAELSFSSETAEVNRWWGIEVLDHSPRAVDLSRLKKTGSHLFNHNPDKIIGPLKKPRIEGGRGLAVVGYDETDEGNQALIRTKSGSLRGVSAGYRVLEFRELAPGEEYQMATKTIKGRKDITVMVATKWQPVEISSTPVPWDTSVGLGRDATRSLSGIEIIRANNQTDNQTGQPGNLTLEEGSNVEEKEIRFMLSEAIKAMVPEISRQVQDGIRAGLVTDITAAVQENIAEAARPKMNVSTETGRDLLNRAGAVSLEAKSEVSNMLFDGKLETEILRHLQDKIMANPDARDSGGAGGDGTGRGNNPAAKGTGDTRQQPITSFKNVKDDDFFRAFGGTLELRFN